MTYDLLTVDELSVAAITTSYFDTRSKKYQRVPKTCSDPAATVGVKRTSSNRKTFKMVRCKMLKFSAL